MVIGLVHSNASQTRDNTCGMFPLGSSAAPLSHLDIAQLSVFCDPDGKYTENNHKTTSGSLSALC